MSKTLAELVQMYVDRPRNAPRLPPEAPYILHFVEALCTKALNGDRYAMQVVREVLEGTVEPQVLDEKLQEAIEKVYNDSDDVPFK